MNNLKKITLISAMLLAGNVMAAEEDFHDADPRNSNGRAAVMASDSGEIKLLAGGGFNGLTSEVSQTIGFAEYYTDSNNVRLRGAHFDTFGGVYIDLYNFEDAATMYTAGYMLPLSTEDGTLFFPSLNYTYLNFETDELAQLATESTMNSPIPIKVTEPMMKSFLDGDDAHIGSVNMYALKPWNDVHFTVAQINLGSSYDGVEMNMANIMLVQGIKTKVADKHFNIMFELKYDKFEIQTTSGMIRSEDVVASIGVDYRF